MRRRVEVDGLVEHHLERGEPTGWFEPLYAAVGRRTGRLPWAARGPHPYLVDWLEQPGAAPPGSRALVVGCGLGDDAAHLAGHGLEVTAFDIAPSAVRRARRRHRGVAVDWEVADLLAPPPSWSAAFDLVVEIDTVPWLPGVVRDAAMQGIGSLVAPGGTAVVVTRLAARSEVAADVQGPPWPQAPAELAAYRAAGLEREALEHPPVDESGLLVARLTLRRSAPPTG